MYEHEKKQLLWVVYDGIDNSVFNSQVLAPILKQLDQDETLEITLATFEQQLPSAAVLCQKIPAHDRLHLAVCRKLPFISIGSLWLSIYQLFRLLEATPCHEIRARGPFAGYIARKAVDRFINKHSDKIELYPELFCTKIVVQARGLCAAEYAYTHRKQQAESLLWNIWSTWVYKRLFALEKMVYGLSAQQNCPYEYIIESVSPALKEFLIKTFKAQESGIIIASDDIPEGCSKEMIQRWRQTVRAMLAIPSHAVVYCYSGSFKPWQCAEETVTYFAEQAQRDPYVFLLILSQDADAFKKSLNASSVPEDQYLVLSVDPTQLYEYLSAADFGILFREQDVINWVSRPTKMLEYQAVGLNIIHNNTIAWLASKQR